MELPVVTFPKGRSLSKVLSFKIDCNINAMPFLYPNPDSSDK